MLVSSVGPSQNQNFNNLTKLGWIREREISMELDYDFNACANKHGCTLFSGVLGPVSWPN